MIDHEYDLGPCCGCDKTGPAVRNVVMLGFTAPEPGTGWGCFVCRQPQNGALAVLCDACFNQASSDSLEIKQVCAGRPGEGRRIGIDEYAHEPFGHDMRYHQAEVRTN